MADALSAIILAGGQSSRMGQDKALIPVQGIPLLQRTCRVALQCASSVYVVTSRAKAYHSIASEPCQFVEENYPTDRQYPGPLVGFAQGLTVVDTDWVLLLACDLPYLQASWLMKWFTQRQAASTAIALLPSTEKGWEPLCGFYRKTCLPQLNQFIQQGGRSFQPWLAQEDVQAIAFSTDPEQNQQEHRMLFNCNTPNDYRNMLLTELSS